MARQPYFNIAPRHRRCTLQRLGHSYSIQAFVALHQRAKGDAKLQAKYKDLAQSQADMLARYTFAGGGWAYYNHTIGNTTYDPAFSFTTATGLIALKQPESIGVT